MLLAFGGLSFRKQMSKCFVLPGQHERQREARDLCRRRSRHIWLQCGDAAASQGTSPNWFLSKPALSRRLSHCPSDLNRLSLFVCQTQTRHQGTKIPQSGRDIPCV